jgi:hypothetical protein
MVEAGQVSLSGEGGVLYSTDARFLLCSSFP